MCYVAMHYSLMGSASSIASPDTQAIHAAPDDLYKIQSYLLLALASFARLEGQQGQMSLVESIRLANALRLGREAFVLRQPRILQDSCRRTWWELFVITTLVRSMMDVPVHLSLDDCDLRLPGDDMSYERGLPSEESRTLRDMQTRFFSDDEQPWAASAYKVEATRILATIMSAEDKTPGTAIRSANADSFQASISSWWLSLPIHQRQAIREDGYSDESMFMALMIINMGSLRINLPRSDLAANWRSATLCADFGSKPSTTRDAAYHTASALKAANSLSSLIASEGSTKLHTPCSACAIAFSTIIQLPAYLRQRDEDLKENIQLGLIYLKRMGEVWPLASQVRLQLASVARAVLAPQDDSDPHISRAPEAVTDTSSDMPVQGDQWLEFARQMLTTPEGDQLIMQTDLMQLPDGDDWLEDMLQADTTWSGGEVMT